ncbi:MAG: histidine phosphatase family protein, partial [Cyclobacteriaceae bacterium]
IPVKLEDDDVDKIYTSNIERSIATARAVFKREDIQVPNTLFREFERKIYGFPNVKMPLKWWLRGSRVLWFLGLNKKDVESFKDARARARTATSFLENDAAEEGKTLLVSHGLLNHFIVKYLKEEGWTLVYDGGKGYLSQKVLVKYGERNQK